MYHDANDKSIVLAFWNVLPGHQTDDPGFSRLNFSVMPQTEYTVRNSAIQAQHSYSKRVNELKDASNAALLGAELQQAIQSLNSVVDFFKSRGQKYSIDWQIIYYQSLLGRVKKHIN